MSAGEPAPINSTSAWDLTDDDVQMVWPPLGAAMFAACVTLVAAMGAMITGADLEVPGRRWLILVGLLVAPGWAVLRLLRVDGSWTALAYAVGASLALLLFAGELLVTRLGWNWRLGATAILGSAAFGFLFDHVRFLLEEENGEDRLRDDRGVGGAAQR